MASKPQRIPWITKFICWLFGGHLYLNSDHCVYCYKEKGFSDDEG